MKNKRIILVIILVILDILLGLILFFRINQSEQNISKVKDTTQVTKQELTSIPSKQELINIAEELAQKEGINLDEYQEPKIEYDTNERQWRFYYEVKPPVYPGGCFEILIDEDTKEAKILYCE